MAACGDRGRSIGPRPARRFRSSRVVLPEAAAVKRAGKPRLESSESPSVVDRALSFSSAVALTNATHVTAVIESKLEQLSFRLRTGPDDLHSLSVLPAGARVIDASRSHQDQRQEAKVKREGKRPSS